MQLTGPVVRREDGRKQRERRRRWPRGSSPGPPGAWRGIETSTRQEPRRPRRPEGPNESPTGEEEPAQDGNTEGEEPLALPRAEGRALGSHEGRGAAPR